MRTDEIRARLDAATRGPWEVDINEPFSQDIVGIVGPSGYVLLLEDQEETECPVTEADADLIANAPSDLAYLLSECDRKDAENAELKNRLTESDNLLADHAEECAVLRKALEMACELLTKYTCFKSKGGLLNYFTKQAREAIEHGK